MDYILPWTALQLCNLIDDPGRRRIARKMVLSVTTICQVVAISHGI